jgi:hypothetical protein
MIMLTSADDILRDYLDGLPEKELLVKHGITRAQMNVLRKERGIASRRNAVSRYQKNTSIGDSVTCAICQLEFQDLSSHVKIHGLTPRVYVERYNTKLRTVAASEKLSASATLKFERHPELKDKLREVGRQNIAKVNAEGKGWRTPVGFWSEEQKAHMSRVLMGRQVTWVDKIRESHWSKNDQAQDVIDKMTEKNTTWRAKRGWYLSTKTNVKEFYHSSYELRRMQELDADDNVVLWTKRHTISITYQYAGRERRYVPDFLIETIDGILFVEEVKGYIKDVAQYDAKCSAARVWCLLNGYVYLTNFMKRKP